MYVLFEGWMDGWMDGCVHVYVQAELERMHAMAKQYLDAKEMEKKVAEQNQNTCVCLCVCVHQVFPKTFPDVYTG